VNGFLDVEFDSGPNHSQVLRRVSENATISFFPDFPKEEAWEKDPGSIHNRIGEGIGSPKS
jgi:hypothetical protein